MNIINAGSIRNVDSHNNCDNQYFSLEDLFALDSAQIENNVYELLVQIESRSQIGFKYVQVRKEKIQTWFKKHEVIQIIDVSQKILYEMAVGEKRLFSLINATVSHEMRNPANSIQSQV